MAPRGPQQPAPLPATPASRRYLFGSAAVVVAAGGLALSFGPLARGTRSASRADTAAGAGSENEVRLPAFVRGAEAIEAYRFAIARPDVLQYVPCYCGCGQSDGHTSNLSCFLKGVRPDGGYEFDSHGAG